MRAVIHLYKDELSLVPPQELILRVTFERVCNCHIGTESNHSYFATCQLDLETENLCFLLLRNSRSSHCLSLPVSE